MVSKEPKKNVKKLHWDIILSVALHCILFFPIIWKILNSHIDPSAADIGTSIDALMIEPVKIVKDYENWNRNYLRKDEFKTWNEKQLSHPINQSKERNINIKENFKHSVKEKKISAEVSDKEIQGKTALKKKEVINKIQGKINPLTASLRKEKENFSGKKTIASAGNNLFNNLSSVRNPSTIGNKEKRNGSKTIRGISTDNDSKLNMDITNYAGQIRLAIESRFYNASLYVGKTCTLHIRLAPDGTLLDITSQGGDSVLCKAAITAAHQAKIPIPSSQKVYEVFKDISLDFKP